MNGGTCSETKEICGQFIRIKVVNNMNIIMEEIRQKCQELSSRSWGNDECYLYAKGVQAMYVQVNKIIEEHMHDKPKCYDCSRRKFYQMGYNDGRESVTSNKLSE